MWLWILPLLGLILFEACADYFAGNFAYHGKIIFAVVALLLYIVGNISWLISLKNGSGLTRGAMLFSVGSACAAVLIGFFIYKEELSPHQIVGVFLGLMSVFLILK